MHVVDIQNSHMHSFNEKVVCIEKTNQLYMSIVFQNDIFSAFLFYGFIMTNIF
jgi:hypothetical protein